MNSCSYYQLIFFILISTIWFGTTKAFITQSKVRNEDLFQKAQSRNSSGLTADPCTQSADCAPPRLCFDSDGLCSSSSSNCICAPVSGPQTCTASTECVPGEGCADLSGNQYCVSCEVVRNSITTNFIDDASTCSDTDDDSDAGESSSEAGDGTGLTADPCTQSADCAPPRLCFDSDGLCSSSSSNCICAPVSGAQTCTASTECVPGEGCADLSGNQYCVSCEVVRNSITTNFIDDASTCSDTDDDSDAGESSSEAGDGTGLTADPCTQSADCAPPRLCFDSDGLCSSSSSNCICAPVSGPQTCTASTECVPGEGCADLSGNQYCVSCEVVRNSITTNFIDDASTCSDTEDGAVPESTPFLDDVGDYAEDNGADGENDDSEDEDESDDEDFGDENTESGYNIGDEAVPTGESDEAIPTSESDDIIDADGESEDNIPTAEPEVCVSVIHLKHLRASELVFSEHRQASVLCDSHGSCATPGHLVVYQSHAMTMSRYCSTLPKSCRQRVMLVNSPRMQHGLRIASLTKELEFTVLAAKFETKLEEAMLRILVQLGM